jgi:hypothetical protein
MAQDTPARQDAPPFGIEPRHIDGRRSRWLRPFLIVVFIALPLLAALAGMLGGGTPSETTVATPLARLSVETPRILRSGNWFETRVIVLPSQDVADLVVEIDEPLWRAMSIDTVVPDADGVASLDGTFAYSFGPVRKGERFLMKFDGQIQPRWLRRFSGRIAIKDGERPLVDLPLAITVLP